MCAPMAHSRLMLSPTFLSPVLLRTLINRSSLYVLIAIESSPNSVLLNISFANQTVNQLPSFVDSKTVTVRQAPFTAMESPRWQSDKMGAASPMVSVQPPSSRVIWDTRPRCSIYISSKSIRLHCVVRKCFCREATDQTGEHRPR